MESHIHIPHIHISIASIFVLTSVLSLILALMKSNYSTVFWILIALTWFFISYKLHKIVERSFEFTELLMASLKNIHEVLQDPSNIETHTTKLNELANRAEEMLNKAKKHD